MRLNVMMLCPFHDHCTLSLIGQALKNKDKIIKNSFSENSIYP